MKKELEKIYELKTHVLGPGENDEKQVKVLNRIVTWTDQGVQYEADPRHAEIVIKQLGLENAKGLITPGTKEEVRTKEDHENEPNEEYTSIHRAITARLNYLASDRADLAFAVNDVAREMSEPTQGSSDGLKRIGRYLVSSPRVVLNYGWQQIPDDVQVFTAADWAGCKTTRKSTSGWCIMC